MAAVMEAAAADGGHFLPAVIDIGNVEKRVERSLLTKVHRLIDEYPELALEVIRAWMAEGR